MPRAVVAKKRFGHERRGLACQPGDVADDVLASITWSAASTSERRYEIDLALAAGGDLVIVGDVAIPHSAMRWAISVRRSARLSVGGQGK